MSDSSYKFDLSLLPGVLSLVPEARCLFSKLQYEFLCAFRGRALWSVHVVVS